jgi:hypothetical protein
MPTPGNGYFNEIVKAGVPVMLQHCGTQENLASDHILYRNDFGNELEVSAKCLQDKKGKIMMLSREKVGEIVRENTQKDLGKQNYWSFQLAESATTLEDDHKVVYSGRKLVEDMRGALNDRLLTIRMVLKYFKMIDRNHDLKVDPNELRTGLEHFSIFLNEEQIKAVMADFDKDHSGSINFREFASLLVVSLLTLTVSG